MKNNLPWFDLNFNRFFVIKAGGLNCKIKYGQRLLRLSLEKFIANAWFIFKAEVNKLRRTANALIFTTQDQNNHWVLIRMS